MKAGFLLFLVYIFISQNELLAQCGGGELYFFVEPYLNTTFKMDVSIVTSEYCWYWDDNNNKPSPNPTFQSSFTNETCTSYLAPKRGSGYNVIPWGLFTINVKGKNQYGVILIERTFTLDLRDENWSIYNEPNYPGVDTFIEFNTDVNPVTITISARQNGINRTYTVNDNSIFRIWEMWGIDVPLQSNFKVPVTLKNRIEDGPSTDFGSLWANNHEVTSGTPEEFKYLTLSNNVQHYTTETNYNNERKFSFKWIPNQIQLSGNNYSGNTIFTILVTSSPKDITRNFKTVWPLKLKNVSIESNSTESFGNIYFKDPTTDNQFHQYPASGPEGFVKNEAFAELDEEVNGQPHQKYSVKTVPSISHNGRNYYWYSGDFNPTTPTDLLVTVPTTKTAGFKGTQLSSQTNAYANNSQRKFVRTDDGWLHSVYESLGRVWYEAKSPTGSWEIMNGGQPLDNGEGKQPSIDYSFFSGYDDYYQVFIVYQEKSGTASKIKVKYFHKVLENPSMIYKYQADIASVSGSYTDINTTPVIGSYNGNFTVVWKNGTESLYARNGSVNVNNGITLFSSNSLTGTTSNSINTAIYSSKTCCTWIKTIAWEETGTNNTASIKYGVISGSQLTGSPVTISSGSGYTKNYQPSIIEINGTARVVWIGYRQIIQDDKGTQKITSVSEEYRVIFRGTDYYYFWGFGNNVNSPNINKIHNNTGYIFAWSESTTGGFVNKFGNQTLSTPKTIPNISGRDVQVSNGPANTSMYANVFNNLQTPYYFTVSQSLGSIQKINGLAFSSGREGVVYKGEGQFYFMVGDVKVDEQVIDFIEIPDTVNINDREALNAYLITEPFVLTDNSNFFYGVQYGITDSTATANTLDNDDYINFKVELADNVTGEVLGLFDNITYTKENLFQYNNISYQVNTQGIGNRTVRLRLSVDDNFSPDYSLSQKYADEDLLMKVRTKEVSYRGTATVDNYNLAQNYPNPFNPSTKIKYQIPEDGIVTLKIYDILGKEVATLVNEQKTIGRYEINFDASNLASGVYIYRIQVNDPAGGTGFTSSKKMLLLK
jgi:hypothetical protein